MTTTKPDVQALIEEAEQFADGWKGNDFAVVWEPFDQPAKIRFWNDRDTAISDAENIQRNDDIKNWEAAHGHDVRLKCYPEFQCAAIELYAAYLVTRLTEALSALSGETETECEYGVLGTLEGDGKHWNKWVEQSREEAEATVSRLTEKEKDYALFAPRVSGVVVRRAGAKAGEWEVVV